MPQAITTPAFGRVWLAAWLVISAFLLTFGLSRHGATSYSRPLVDDEITSNRVPKERYETKPIEDLVAGDFVLAADPISGEVRQKRVLRTFHRISDHLRIISFRSADGTSQVIKTTNEHPFRVMGRAFVKASELSGDDRVVGPHGEIQTVVSSTYEPHPKGAEVFNIEVEGFHTYFVGQTATTPPILVHNKAMEAERKVTSRAARRKAMREADIPTSQQPVPAGQQIGPRKTVQGESFEFDVPAQGGGTKRVSVQQTGKPEITKVPEEPPHWEAGEIKPGKTDGLGRPRLKSGKGKVPYEE